MDRKRLWGRVSLSLAVCLMVVFTVLASGATSRQVDCDLTSDRCLARAIQALDAPLLWVIPAVAGAALTAGLFLLASANRAPPERATGFTWEDWEEAGATH